MKSSFLGATVTEAINDYEVTIFENPITLMKDTMTNFWGSSITPSMKDTMQPCAQCTRWFQQGVVLGSVVCFDETIE